MVRIAIAECKQEVSSFNPVPSRYEDFRVHTGAAILDYHRHVREEVGGAMQVFGAAAGVEMVPAYATSSNTSGGKLATESFQRLLADFLAGLKAAGSVDAAYFALHGAMQAEDEDDPEGALLAGAREILGEEIPIVISLDLHGILTDRMLKMADAVVVFHTYPHVDFYETGERAAQLLLRILEDSIRPVMARVKIPVLARGDEMITATGAVSKCIKLAQEIEAAPGALAAGLMWGNPFTDVPELRSNAIVVMEGDEDLARRHATTLARSFWEHRHVMQVPLTSLEEAVHLAEAEVGEGTVVMMDAADATSSGASGDSNAILRECLRQSYTGRLLAPVVDPDAVAAAFAAGVGEVIRTPVGGALDSARYQPLDVEARVRSLADGRFRSESFGWHWDAGPTAVLDIGPATLVVGTRPVSLFDRSFFWANGQDPRHFDLVVVKSPHCEPQMFADWCRRLINVDAPGSTSANLHSLGHTLCERPIFPLDKDVEASLQADLFRRG